MPKKVFSVHNRIKFIETKCNQHITVFAKKPNYFVIYTSASNPLVQNLLKIFFELN